MRKRHAPAASKTTGRASPRRPTLLAVKLDDELLVDRAVNVVTNGHGHDARAHLATVGGRDPVGTPTSSGGLPSAFDVRVLAARLFDADRVARLNLERGDVNLAPIA